MQVVDLDRSPVADVTGSGAAALTVMPLPSPGRRTAISGLSVPASRLAWTLAEVRTPSSGASTVAPLSANCWKPRLGAAGQPAAQVKASGTAVVSSDPRIVDACAAGAPTSSAAVARRRGRRVMHLRAQHWRDWISAERAVRRPGST